MKIWWKRVDQSTHTLQRSSSSFRLQSVFIWLQRKFPKIQTRPPKKYFYKRAASVRALHCESSALFFCYMEECRLNRNNFAESHPMIIIVVIIKTRFGLLLPIPVVIKFKISLFFSNIRPGNSVPRVWNKFSIISSKNLTIPPPTTKKKIKRVCRYVQVYVHV